MTGGPLKDVLEQKYQKTSNIKKKTISIWFGFILSRFLIEFVVQRKCFVKYFLFNFIKELLYELIGPPTVILL